MLSVQLRTACASRRAQLAARLAATCSAPCAVLPAGVAQARNYPANTFPFRASSHFLYLVGVGLEGCTLWLSATGATLFVPERHPFDDLWHGPVPTFAELELALGLEVRPLSELSAAVQGQDFACPPLSLGLLPPELRRKREQSEIRAAEADLELAEALVSLRLTHDAAALTEIRRAVTVSIDAHRAGIRATRQSAFEREVQAAMEHVCTRSGFGLAYGSIVTVHGEVLHNHEHHHALKSGDLMLADVGAESDTGYASDITRTWPVSGQFSATQRDLYQLVLAMQQEAIARVAPGVRYRDIHLAAARVLVDGLSQLKILHGEIDSLMEDAAYALFFPHGVGHLLGLDVHDMEDLGDLAGYAEGRERSQTFGLSYLRLDRDLAAGMVVTIEPGFYQVPSLLRDPARVGLRADCIDRTRLSAFSDVHGIRIEDDVLVTSSGSEVLSQELEKSVADIESLMAE